MATQKQSIVEDGSLEFAGAQKADAQALSAPFSGPQDLAEANVQPALGTDVRWSMPLRVSGVGNVIFIVTMLIN